MTPKEWRTRRWTSAKLGFREGIVVGGLSVAAKHRWIVCEIDMWSAPSQAKWFKWNIFVWPPRKTKDEDGLWKFVNSAYDLFNPGRLWHLASYELLTKRYGFVPLRLYPSMYLRKNGNNLLLSVVQVEDFLYARLPELAPRIESFSHKKFQIGSSECTSFTEVDARLAQYIPGKIAFNAIEKLD